MKTDTDRMRWAVTFGREAAGFHAETNVMALTERDLGRMRREVQAFLAGDAQGLAVTVHNFGPAATKLSRRALFDLQIETHDLLRAAALGVVGRGSATRDFPGRGASTKLQVFVDVVRPRGLPPELRIGGQLRDAFLMALALLLATDVGRQVATCPECGAIFVKVRRQLYCAAKCTDRATWRNYPAAKKRRARERQYAKHGWTVGARTDAKEKKR